MLYKHRVPDGQAYVFYMDVRAGGKGYEEFFQRAVEEDGVIYLRGRVSKLFEENGKIVVWGADTLTGRKVEIEADLVVLAMAMVPSGASKDISSLLKLPTDEHGFFSEAHPKLRPVDTLTEGIFLAGCSQAPKDIPETVAQAKGAASGAASILSKDYLEVEPMKASVLDENCDGCAYCIEPCPFDAITLVEYMRDGSIKKTVEVDEISCRGCGTCMATCPKKGIDVRGFRLEQLSAMVSALLSKTF